MNARRFFLPVLILLIASAGRDFAQTISTFSPLAGSVNDLVTLTGSGFAPGGVRPTKLTVKFNTTIGTTNIANVISDSEIQVQVPTNATTGYISVSVNNGPTVNSFSPFVVVGAIQPYSTNFSPFLGGAGTSVTNFGLHFQNVTNVAFNGVPGVVTFRGANQINVNAPSGVNTGPLTLMSSLGVTNYMSTATNAVSNTTNFFVQPLISGFSPTSGRSGTNVIITGANFLGASAVVFEGNTPGFTVLSNGAIQLTVPANCSSGSIQVTGPAGPSSVTTTNFHMLPTVSGFSPAFGSNGTGVVISGANLNEVAGAGKPTVSFNGASGNVSGYAFGSITCSVPASASSGPLLISTTNGSFVTANFYVSATISGFTPTNSAPGTMIQINGSNFTNATAVSFNGTPATGFYVTNNTTIGAVVPPGILTGPISVTTPANTATSSGLFYGAPGITNFTPTAGPILSTVTIQGTNFTGATAVLFNGTNAVFTVTNNSLIGAIVPANASSGPLTVIAPGGSNTTLAIFTINSTNDIGLDVTNSQNTVFATSNLVYTLTVYNNGLTTAQNVMLSNLLPASVTLKSASSSQGTLNTSANPIWGNLGSLTESNFATIILTVVPKTPGLITNTAWVSSDSVDPNLSNNTNSVVTTVWPLPFLTIQPYSANQVKVLWPAPLSNFTLQYVATLGITNHWTNDTAAKFLSSTNVFITETNLGIPRFYRLTN